MSRLQPIDPDHIRDHLPSFEIALAENDEIEADVARYLRFFRLFDLVARANFRHTIGTIDGRNETIVVQAFQPANPKGTIFLVHGYFDHVGLYRHVIELMLNLGLTVIALDLPGHGLSSGPKASISNFDDYCHAVQGAIEASTSLHQAPMMALGQSTGGAIVTTLALAKPDLPGMQRVILFAPLVRPWRWKRVQRVHTFLKLFGVSKISRKFVSNSHDPQFLEFLETKDPLQARYVPEAWVASMRKWESDFTSLPMSQACPLIIQGGSDETVDWRYNLRAIRERFKQTNEIVLPEAKHHLANESSAIRAIWVGAIEDQVATWLSSCNKGKD